MKSIRNTIHLLDCLQYTQTKRIIIRKKTLPKRATSQYYHVVASRAQLILQVPINGHSIRKTCIGGWSIGGWSYCNWGLVILQLLDTPTTCYLLTWNLEAVVPSRRRRRPGYSVKYTVTHFKLIDFVNRERGRVRVYICGRSGEYSVTYPDRQYFSSMY